MVYEERWSEVEPTLLWRNDGGAGLTLWWYEKKQEGVRTC